MFTLTIETGNAAFEEDDLAPELARILQRLAGQLRSDGLAPGGGSGAVRDVNGATVGRWTFEAHDVDTLGYCAWCEEAGIAAGEGHDPECPFGGSRLLDYPEGTLATCRYCGEPILLDLREGGGPAKDWGARPEHWIGNGGTGMDYGCGDNPESDDDGTAGHVPELDTIERP